MKRTLLYLALLAGFVATAPASEAADITWLSPPDHVTVSPSGEGLDKIVIRTRLAPSGVGPITGAYGILIMVDDAYPRSIYFCGVDSRYYSKSTPSIEEGNGIYRFEIEPLAGINVLGGDQDVYFEVLFITPSADYQAALYDVEFASPDLTGDLRVNLADIGEYARLSTTGYDFRIDFNGDGLIDLADIGILSESNAGQCP